MTGNTVVPQILGASTVAGVAAVALPVGGPNHLFSMILIGVIAICAAVVIARLVKIFATKKVK